MKLFITACIVFAVISTQASSELTQEYCESVEFTTDECLDNSQGLWNATINEEG
jgi:hypothetical protein